MNWNGLSRLFKAYFATLIATTVFLPGLLALISVFIYITCLAEEGIPTLKRSWLIGISAWLLLSFFCHRLATARNCIPSSFGELQGRLTQLQAVLGKLAPPGGTSDPPSAASLEITKQVKEIEDEIKKPGLLWLLARGYVNVWDRMYRAEEALIEVEPRELVLAGALYDELRLDGSTIDNSEELLAKLRQGAIAIDSHTSVYLKPFPPGTKQLSIITPSVLLGGTINEPYDELLYATGGTPPYTWKITAGNLPNTLSLDPTTGAIRGTPAEIKEKGEPFTVQVTDKAGLMIEKQMLLIVKNTSGTHKEATVEPLARAVLRTVRRSINEHRGKNWDGLIVARNRLLGTMLTTTLTAYALLAIAILCKVPKSAITAASIFYFVGATVGLFSRLRTQSKADTAIEDYGLSAARLVTIPVFSGLAAIGGIVLVAMAPYVNTVFGPTTPASPPLAIITSSPLPEGTVNAAYKQLMHATGGTPPYTWKVTDGTTGELELDPPTGLLSGTPKEATKYVFTMQTTDKAGLKTEKPFVLSIKGSPGGPGPAQETKNPLTIVTPSPLPEGSVNAAYKQPLRASGGTPPYNWKVIGEAPPGLSLDPGTGVLSGTPTTAETSKFTLEATDKTGKTARIELALTVKPAPAGAPATQSPPALKDVFNLDKYLLALLLAAVFGLTPELLFDGLLKQTERLKGNLKSSEATQEAKQT